MRNLRTVTTNTRERGKRETTGLQFHGGLLLKPGPHTSTPKCVHVSADPMKGSLRHASIPRCPSARAGKVVKRRSALKSANTCTGEVGITNDNFDSGLELR